MWSMRGQGPGEAVEAVDAKEIDGGWTVVGIVGIVKMAVIDVDEDGTWR